MDWKTVQGRVKHEGFSFLTITLPNFGKDFQKALDQGYVDRRLFTGFQWKGGLPRFLGGFLGLVFDRSSGALLSDPSVDAIHAVRQLSLMFGKIALPCSDTRVRSAIDDFIECEQDVRTHDASRSRGLVLDFERMSSVLFTDLFVRADREIYELNVVPKHGPGATAEKLTSNGKYNQRAWTERLETIFPSLEMLFPSASYYEELDGVDILEPGSETPIRVVTVPKTLKTPRIIGIEPAAMQYSQQAIMPLFVEGIKRDSLLDSFIGFDDQTPNQVSARVGSLTGNLATLDLSEASDRVSNQLVRAMLRRWPHLHMAVDACRSRKADVPGYGVKRLAKFAMMGSALCFPVEAMVFTTIIFLGIEKSLNKPLTRRDLKCLSGQVRVYGDDIIVPVEHVRPVVQMLETFGFRVNLHKSFWNGKFRESCGKEYYAGHDVSVVKVRTEFPTRLEHVTGIISLVETRNQFYFAGYWQTCKWLDERIREVIRHFPVVAPSSPVLGRNSFLGYEVQGTDDALQRPFVRGYVVSAQSPSDPLDGHGALLKYLLKHAYQDRYFPGGRRDDQPVVDSRHLERAGRPHAVNIKLRNACPY
jgi:hypothetical protein